MNSVSSETPLCQDASVLRSWFNKEEAVWPPRPEVRFAVGTRVECRIGAHLIKGWAPGMCMYRTNCVVGFDRLDMIISGVITAQYYSEPGWPQSMYAPYQVRLDDGRMIFAPQDIDEVKCSCMWYDVDC